MTLNKPGIVSVGTLADAHVRNRAGEHLGRIEEIMLDVDSGSIAYAVLSFGGFLGIGDKLFAIPWSALELNPEDHSFLLDVRQESLENAPGFDKDCWPDMADPGWSTQVQAHWDSK
jgi:sporulation protein YlmC with PRC-barrel domain